MERLHLPFVNGLLYCRPYMIENISGLDHLCNAAGIDDRSIEVMYAQSWVASDGVS